MDNFIFRMEQWRAAVAPSTPTPPDAPITLLLDSSPTANLQSDESAFACGFISHDEVFSLNVLDMSAQKWKGGSLCDEALRLLQKWSPAKFAYENIPGMDWFCDLLQLKAETKSIALPPIHRFTPHNGKLAKENRIRKLQTLFDDDPPAIVFHEGLYCEKLFEQARRFRIGGDRRGAENGLLDSLSLLAGFR